MKDYSPTAIYIYAEKIVYRLSLLGFSTAEVVIAMVLIPFVFFLAGAFVGCVLMWVHLWISQNGEKKKRGPWFTAFVYILLLASVVGLFWIGERLAGICPWGFGVLVDMMLLLGGVDIVVGKKCARRM